MTFENKVSNRKQAFKPQLLLLGSQLMHGDSHIINIIIIHLKYFAVSDWLKLNPRLILHKLIFS